jgi:glycosyltransferase involved in cell wall biosynthesis
LPALYSLARVFVFPFWYEGFGLPVLEAMACGTAVVAASAGALPEVVGKAGPLLDPDDAAGLARTIEPIVVDAGLRQDLGRRSVQQAGRFSWERCARQTAAVYARPVDG